MRRRLKEIRVGGVIIVALAIIIGAVFFIGGKESFFGGKVKYKILFDSTGGLYAGDPILLGGVEVGNVIRLWFPEEVERKKILVEISILKEISPRIRKDTRAKIGSASLVYGKVVQLTMGSPEEPEIPEGGFIEATEMTSYTAIVDSANLMVEDIRSILQKIDRGDGALGLLVNEPSEMGQTLHNLSLSSQRLAGLLDRVDRGEGPVGALLSDSVDFRQTLKDVKKTAADLGEVAGNLKGKESVVGKLINDQEYADGLMKDLRSAVHSLASVAAKIDTGKGTLGSLVNDKEVYYGLQDVVLGVQKSKITKWLIQNRRKAGEKERIKQQEDARKEKGERK